MPIIYLLVFYRFVYLSNNQSILFENWGSYTADTFGVQPDNFGGNEHCVLFNGAKADNWNWISHLGTWSDFQCDQSEYDNYYICEKKIQN